jgi:hypothetical protein
MVDWRVHAGGMKQLIKIRGGFRHLMNTLPYLVPTASTATLQPTNITTSGLSIIATANTYSPSWDQVPLSDTPEQNIVDDVKEIHKLIFASTLCPRTLFFAAFRILQLRKAASAVLFSGAMDYGHSLEAHGLLTEIEAFSPEDWAKPGESHDNWPPSGTIYQSTVALYCSMAFRSLTISPNSLEMNAVRCALGDRLLSRLRLAINAPCLTYFQNKKNRTCVLHEVLPGIEPGSPESFQLLRIRCDDRYTIKPSHKLSTSM